MPHVRRDADGALLSLHRQAEPGADEYLPDDHPDVRAFLGPAAANERAEFARLDAEFVRVLEDVIDTLIHKHLINITDLPTEAQAKLFSRKTFRERRPAHALNLFGDADLGDLVPAAPRSSEEPPR